MSRRTGYSLVATLLSVLLSAGCAQETIPEPYQPTSAHEAYVLSLRALHLEKVALGRDWIELSKAVLGDSLVVQIPFRETLYFESGAAFAQAYQFDVRRGQRTEIDVELQNGADSTRVFIDLFRVEEKGSGWVLVATAPEGERHLEFEPHRDGTYMLRLQPELLRGGQITLSVHNLAALSFPVQGRTTRSILSAFGAPREAGRRSHHGVDIFASRHTPVVAVTRARVRRVSSGGLGGRMIWLWDPERSLHFYYAHLQTQEVAEGTWVEPGERIGTVGNSGNARTTPPHLHFGIYARGEGPVDPFPFLDPPPSQLRRVEVDTEGLGEWHRVKVAQATVWSRADKGAKLDRLERNTAVQVLAGSGRMYRVVFEGRRQGYVAASQIELADQPLRKEFAAESTLLLDRPMPKATPVLKIRSGQQFWVLGQFGAHWLVKTVSGKVGWLNQLYSVPSAE